MDTAHLILKRFLLFSALTFALTGCGSNSSSSPTADNGTGSIAAKLIWSAESKTTAKTLYLTPAGVTNVRITVSGTGISPAISKNFAAVAGTAGSGTIDGIPIGTGRTITAWGMDNGGVIRYQGAVSGITINLGTANAPVAITMTAPVTTATPAGGTYNSAQLVTLTSDTPATIYYTTNLLNPYTNGGNQPTISIPASTNLYFYAIDSGFAQESTKTETYIINGL